MANLSDIFKKKKQEVDAVQSQIESGVGKVKDNVVKFNGGVDTFQAPKERPTSPFSVNLTDRSQPFLSVNHDWFGDNNKKEERDPLVLFNFSDPTKPLISVDKDRLKHEPYVSPKGSLSERSRWADASRGIDYSLPQYQNPEQILYNDTYYRILDDPAHTKMYTGLERYYKTDGSVDIEKAEDFRSRYKTDHAKLEAEYERIKDEYGKDSIKTRAFKQFLDNYEELGRDLESKFSGGTGEAYSEYTDDTIRELYGAVLDRPDFAEKAKKGREQAAARYLSQFIPLIGSTGAAFQIPLNTFMSSDASTLQKDLVGYILETEGYGAAVEFIQSNLGRTAAQAAAQKEYASNVADKNTLRRGLSMGLNTLDLGLQNFYTGSGDFIRALVGLDKDDETDKQLALEHTISDVTDSYLKSQITGEYSTTGLTEEQFDYIADLGTPLLKQAAGSSQWYKDAEKNASDYQKQVLGYLYACTEDAAAVESVWEYLQEREKAVWEATKKDSKRGAPTSQALIYALNEEYLGLGGTKLPGFFSDVAGGEGVTLEQALHQAGLSAAQQIIPTAASIATGGVAAELGATTKVAESAANWAGNIASSGMYGGMGYSEARDKGLSREAALGYGGVEAALELVTGRLLDGAAAGTSRLTGGLRDKVIAKIANPAAKAFASAGIRAGGEMAEEYIQESVEPIINYLFFHEGDWKDAFLGEGDTVPEQVLNALLDPDRLYAGVLGGLTALAMSPGTVTSDISSNFSYRDLGASMSKVGAIDTAVDLILSNPADVNPEAYEAAKKTAELIKGGTKVSDLAKGEMIANFVRAGGDISILTNPDTMVYNKDVLTLEDYIAGATSMLVSLDGDVELAEDVAKVAMGEEISDDAMAAIQKDTSAVLVLSQLLGDLDMSEDTALSRAAEAFTTRTGEKTYATLVAKNPDKTVVNPVTQQLITAGVKLEDAKGVGEIVGKAMDGKKITKAEAKKINVKDAAVVSVINETLGTKLSETSTPAQVLSVLNDYAASMVETKEMQAAVKSGAKAAADARMTAAGRVFRPAGETVTIGGVQYSHDAFISDYMAKNGATREQAEEAWNGLRRVSAAFYGEEENDGRRTVSGNEEGRHVSLAAGGAVSEGTERRAGSGRTAVTGTESTTGGVEETGDGAVSETPRGEKITKLNSEQREFAESARDDGFSSVTLIKGPLLNAAGNEVNAKVDGAGNLTIRWDNPYASARRVERHERLHLWLSVFGPGGEARANFVMNALTDILESYDPSEDGGFSEVFATFGEAESREITLESLYERYAEVYAEAYAGLSEQEFSDRIYEEILADMYAGLDLYDAGTDIFEDQAEMYILESGLREDFFRGEGKDEDGDDRFSASVEPGRYDLSNPFRDSTDWNLPTDVRPFPGEEPMHTQLERFSVSSMVDGANFDLQLNSEGYPYALIDRRTGERVTHVTEKMMIGTPLGNIIQMAVKSKDNPNGITEKEAKAQRQMLADAMNLIVKYNDAAVVWELVGSQLFSAVKANSDKQYNKTIDFSTICKKTMAIVDAMSETMKRLGRGLTRREVEVVYEETGRAGQATPCPVCYVFSRWMGIGNLLDQIRIFQEQYADMSEEELIDFMRTIDGKRTADGEQGEIYDFLDSLSESKREEYIDKNGLPKIGKILSELKSKPNSTAAKAIEKLQQHQQSLEAISNLTNALPNATPEQAPRWRALINSLQKNILDETQIQELNDQMEEADRQVERYEAYQWLAKTVLMADASKVNEDGEAVGGWKKNKKYNKVPNDILFDLNRGGDFAKDYPLTWAFRTGKGCAMGKAILPYSDARVGETIQGVALSDVKKIRIGGMEELQKIMNDQSLTGRQKATARGRLNEFRIGDVKKASKTLATGRKKMKQQNLIGGMRYQSTSDFRYEFGSDYLMSFLEMQALGANVQLYTKVIEAVDFLASTGADCNLSVMPLGDGYVEVVDPETGEVVIDPKTGKPKLKLAFSNVTGINAEAAIKKSRQYDNVQLILVGINDTNIRLALEGDDVTFVIPFHGSGQSVHQIQTLMDMIGEHLDVTQAQDYTDVQSDHPLPMEDDTHKGPGYRTKEQKAMWDLRMAIIMGKCAGGLNAKQQALLNKNKHLQKLYNMFYVDASAPAYHNYLAEDQAKQIFPYEYWDKTTTYATADRNGEIFQDYCRSMGIAPRFSGTNSKGETVDHGDFTKDKGYWKLLIDRSMYKNVYNENGEWIGYGEYRDQQAINMSNIKLSDLDPETGKAQFTNGEMSKQYDATHNEQDRESRDAIVTRSIQRIEALRDKTDVFREGDIYDRTRVSKGAREDLMKAQSEMRSQEGSDTKNKKQSEPSVWYSVAISDPVFNSENRKAPIRSANNNDVFYIRPSDSSWEVEFDEAGNLMNTDYLKDRGNGLGFHIFDNPHDDMSKTKGERQQQPADLPEGVDRKLPPERTEEKVEKGNPTQRENTRATYGKVGRILEEAFGKERAHNLRILDASSGMGYGVKDLLKMGFKSENVVDLEPFPPPDGSYVPYYRQYGDLMKALQNGTEEPFDVVISNAVINVMAQDARAEIIAALGKFAKPDGHIFINTFKPDNIQSDKYTFYTDLDPSLPSEKRPSTILRRDNPANRIGEEVFVRAGANMAGNIQKAFYPEELRGFVRDILNQTGTEGFSFSNVKPIDKKSIGMQTLWVNMNGETVEEQGRKLQPSERYSIGTPEENRDKNNKQTVTGSTLRTLKGQQIKRYSGIAGKEVSAKVKDAYGKEVNTPQIYVHKDYADQVIPKDVLDHAKEVLQTYYPKFKYNTLMWEKKTGVIRFDEAPNFDTAREPIAGRTVTIYPDGTSKPGYSDSIWHHKWMWVGDNPEYKGFDVRKSWEWSRQWLNELRDVPKSEHTFKFPASQRSIANGTGSGPDGWHEQLAYYGLPADPASEIEKKSRKDEIAAIKADAAPNTPYHVDGAPYYTERASIAPAETLQERYSMVDKQFNDWAPEFYSKMANVVNEWTNGKGQPLGAKMAAGQVVGWLKGKGVKDEEIKWSGIVPFLEGKKSVTKEELLRVMTENEVKIETKVLSREFNGKGYYYEGMDPRDGSERNIANVDALFDYIDELTKDLGLKPGTLVPKPDPYDASVNVINRSTGELVTHIQYREPSVTDHTHWKQYTLPGGDNYREILFKMPAIENYTNRAMTAHWDDESGVIAHARVQDMGDLDGGRVLFVEEIQSDLHNAATQVVDEATKTRRGYQKEMSYKELNAHRGKLKELEDNVKQKGEHARKASEIVLRDHKTVETLQNKVSHILGDTPISADLDLGWDIYTSWMSRTSWLMQDSTEGVAEPLEGPLDIDYFYGRSRVSEQEMADFNASQKRVVGVLMNQLTDSEKAEIENIRKNYKAYENSLQEESQAEQELRKYEATFGDYNGLKSEAPPDVPFAGSSDTYHELVMKHLLRLAAEGNYDKLGWTTAQQQSDRWSDEYAEGYHIEYDQSLPKFMNKYGKQWGSKVGSTVLENGEEVWSVDITPEMKDSVLHEGQPRFSVAPTDESDKKNPFKPGSFEATVYDLVQKSGDGRALQDAINKLIEKRNENLNRDKAPVIPSKDLAKPINKKQKEIQLDQLQKLLDTYGALKKGEKAARNVSFPERTKEDRYTRRFTRTAAEAKGIPERMVPEMIDSLLTEDLLTYARITDKGAIKRGDAKFDDLGYKKAIKEWNDNIASSYSTPTKYDIAFGERLLVEAARNGDDAVAMKVLADLSAMGTQAGQVVQSMRLLKKLGPTGQLYYVQKAVDRLNKQNESRIAKGSWNPIVINQDLAKAVILSETTEDMETAMGELLDDIAKQVPVTLKDKWDAWRYLSMLGNPRTHIRNILGNAVFMPVRFVKDLLSAAGQKMFIKDPMERTKDIGARLGGKKYAAIREFADADFDEMKPQITGTGKMNPLNEIMDRRKIFKSKLFGWVNTLIDWNTNGIKGKGGLEGEDEFFLRREYINAMTQFIAAKGLTLEDLNGSTEGGKILNEARQFAALEAQKATYRDFNRLATALNQAKRAPGVGFLLDGLLPFTKTPLNILRRGIEYSPIGLANGIYSWLVRVGKGDISAADAIDQMAAGLTGTGVAILGMFLASLGLARGGEDDDDKKEQLEAAEGHQKYSLEIPGYGSYTIDWMAPVALPFFVGVEVYNQLNDGGEWTIWDWANALTLIAEPLTSLSMLDGVNSTLAAVRYGDPDEALSTVATNLLTSYLSQGAPTLFGQIARTADPDRRSTYTDKNTDTPAWLQRFAQGLQGKNFINQLPGSADDKMAYVDVWGRKDTSESLFLRALENFISPGYASRIHETPVDRELIRLAESLGDSSVLPSSVAKYFQVEGETLNLNAKQYEQLKTVTGQTAFSLLGNVMDDAIYLAMDDEQKAMVIKEIMSISAAIGKQAVAPTYKPDSWIQRAIDQDNLETAAMYHALGKMDTGLSGYQLIGAMDWLTDDERGKLIMSEHSNTPRNMTDYTKKKYKFVLTDEQIAREREIYNGLFWQSYAALISDPKYIRAGVAERAKMISDMQSDLGEAARRQLGDELRAAGYTSVLLDDSDVPEQVTNLYDLLNRGSNSSRFGKGNIDLTDRNTGLYDENGNIMTVDSIGIEEDGVHIVIPTVVKKNGKWVHLSEDEAIAWYHKTGEYLGKFKTQAEADAYAWQLHLDQEKMYG